MNKFTILVIILLSSQASAEKLNFQAIAGKYRISHKEEPVVSILNITEKAKVTLSATGPFGELNCSGKARIKGKTIISKVSCQKDLKFTYKLDLTGVEEFEKFIGVVYNSLYDTEVEMNFEKLLETENSIVKN